MSTLAGLALRTGRNSVPVRFGGYFMIVAKENPLPKSRRCCKGYNKVLNVGCGTCVSVCLTGGEKEVAVLNTEIEMARRLDDDPINIHGHTIETTM